MNENLDLLRKWSSTSLFIVPLLGKQIISLDQFAGSFIKDEVRGIDYNRGVYVLFKVKDKDKFRIFLEEERNRGSRIIEEYDYKNSHTMVVYQYSKEFERDVEIILSGKFSKTSNFYQNSIPKTFKVTKAGVSKDMPTFQHCVFKKFPEYIDYWRDLYGLEINYKEDEVWHLYKEREIFTQEKLNLL